MDIEFLDNVLVETTTTGTGALTQGAAVSGYRAPPAGANGLKFLIKVFAVNSSGLPTGDWELTESVYTHSGTTWSRGTLRDSSTGSRISFASGTKRISIVLGKVEIYDAVKRTDAFPPIASLIWDSGENPALGSTIPASVVVNTANCEVWVVSRGVGAAAIDLGDGTEGMLYGASIATNDVNDLIFYAGGTPWVIKAGVFWPRATPTVHGIRGNGTSSVAAHINGVDYGGAVAATTASVDGGKIGGSVTLGAGYDLNGEVFRVLIFSSNLTTGERTTLLAYLRSRYGFEAYDTQIICDGDSITAGYNSVDNTSCTSGWVGDVTYGYPYWMAKANPSWKVLNHGVVSKKIADMENDAATGIDPYYDAANFQRNIVILFGGTNDIVDSGVEATVKADTAEYIADRQAAGWEVWAIPPMDRNDFSAGERTIRNNVHDWYLAGTSGANRVIPLPVGLAGISPWSTYPHLWDTDLTHLSREGYRLLADTISSGKVSPVFPNLTVENILTVGQIRPSVSSVAYGANVVPNNQITNIVDIGTLTGNAVIQNPAGAPTNGQRLILRGKQDATGGRTLTWASLYLFTTTVPNAFATTANLNWAVEWMYDNARAKWVAQRIIEGGSSSGGDTLPIVDSTAVVKGSSDATKLVRIEADTNVPTGTTVVLVAPAYGGTLALLNPTGQSTETFAVNLVIGATTAATNSIQNAIIAYQSSSNTTTTGFGVAIVHQAKAGAGALATQATWTSTWTTSGCDKSKLVLTLDTGVLAATFENDGATVLTTLDKLTVTKRATFSAGSRSVPTAVAYAANVTPNVDAYDILDIGALTGNLTVANPSGTPANGQLLKIRGVQDATGGRTVGFGTDYVFTDDVTNTITTTASKHWSILFEYTTVGSRNKWVAQAVNNG